eukprot:symbB.v1.2.040882.t1/scaffold7260.1/size22244/1
MALGLRKVVQKFARTYKESPEGAKSKRLQQLKDRLKNVVSSHEVVAGEANPDSLQEVAQHLPDVKPKIDWVALSEKIALKEKQPAPDNAEAKSKDNLPRPVVTPARNKYALPEHVLVSLQNVEAIFAVMKVQAGDAVRLSEKVLSLGIQEFYTSQRLVPIGIGLEAVQAVCDLGLRKVVQKFARTYKESPEGAKSKRLQQLKDRLKNVVSSHEVVAGEANPDSLQEVAQHLCDVKPKIDWVALSEKIALKKKQPAPDNAEAKSKDNLPRPVATPARNKRGMSAADVQAYFKEVIDEMTAEHGKPPTAKQLASVTGLAVNEAADVLATLVPKEPPVKKRKRRQQPEDPAQEDPAQEEPVKEPAPPSEVPETAEAEAVPSPVVDLGTPPLLPDNQLGDP